MKNFREADGEMSIMIVLMNKKHEEGLGSDDKKYHNSLYVRSDFNLL